MDADLINALNAADGFLILGMWDHAWNAIEDMPSQWKNHPDSLRRRIDALIGLQAWQKALMLSQDALAVFPRRADLWLRKARLQAQSGDLEGARQSAQTCVSLDFTRRLDVVGDPLLAGIW